MGFGYVKKQRRSKKMNMDDFDKIDTENLEQIVNEAMEGSVPSDLITLADAATDIMINQTKHWMGTVVDYKELMMMYACAIKEIRTKFEVLNTEFKIRYQRNPINFISTRLKRTSSITEKLSRQKNIFSIQSIEENINDVAGVRIICSYIDDIYTIADAFLKQDDITLIAKKDYITNPKPNGYRSLHLIIQIPVFFSNQKKEMKAEVQIRTIAMDFWASLEHQLKYKQEIPQQQKIITELKECAEVIHSTDKKMLEIRKQIEKASNIPSEKDILFEKLSKLDINLD